MEYCLICGAKLKKEMQFCPQCGKAIPGREEKPPRDFWAERLEGQHPEETEEEEDWTREVSQEELKDLNEEDEQITEADFWQEKQREKKEKRRRRVEGILAIILLLAAASSIYFVNRSRVDESVPGSGVYYGQYCSAQGVTVTADLDRAKLMGDGSGELELMGKTISGSWTLDGEEFRFESRDRSFCGVLSQGVLQLSEGDFTYVLAAEGSEALVRWPGGEEIPQPEREVPDYRHWQGDYYGFLCISEGTGIWEGTDGTAVDILCQISMDKPDAGTIRLWSSAGKSGELLGAGDVIFRPGTTEKGRMQLEWGIFQNVELSPGKWVVDPGRSPVSRFPDMLYIESRFVQVPDTENSFSYQIFLKPWGQDWEALLEADPETMPLSHMTPPGYRSWYLPMIQAGQVMPEGF